ncbi:hypothetical protein HPP92_015834 [Vanilla planifolia]|uniref:Prolactin regulatory element-binding protein n=1 Tax=Vanilla planifolia TaxID=51239 RepID=A0A835QMF9_VANPL|nr:hypothetical protein HPP92_015834 [Vanilla planifolia]
MPPCSKTYGLPLYCAAWVPLDRIGDAVNDKEVAETTQDDLSIAGKAVAAEAAPSPAKADQLLVVLGGGGGEGRSGVPNAVLLSQFDVASNSLSDQPVHKLGTEGEVPYRMAMHPGGHGFVCSFLKSCRYFEWDISEGREASKLALKSSEKLLQKLDDAGLQLALTFNSDGTLLAAGGEDGNLRVLKWPSLEVILSQTNAHATVKDLDFSSNGKFLASLGGNGPCMVWDLGSLTAVASLPVECGEKFGFCSFSPNSNILYVTSMHGDQAKISSWSTSSWERIASKKIVREPISAFDISNDGKLLAIGTIEGDVAIASSSDLKRQTTVKKAHLGPVTALDFSHDSRALVSASFDSTARVTLVQQPTGKGSALWLSVLVVLLAILAYYYLNQAW